MSILDEFDADLEDIIGDFEDSLTWNGATYTCTVSYHERRDDVDDAGILLDADLIAVIRSSLFSGIFPGNRETVAVTSSRLGLNATPYYINTHTNDGAAWTGFLKKITET